MTTSSCTMSFTRNDLQKTRLLRGECPVKDCRVSVNNHRVPFQRFRGRMRYLPFCPDHGIRVHKSGFVYYNGPSKEDLVTATRRNLMFHSDYYASHFFKQGNKMESGRLCYESSEDAVSYNVFTEMLSHENALRKLLEHIIKQRIKPDVDLYLWGGKIDLRHNKFVPYKPLIDARKHLEHDIRRFATEPDIMLVVPGKVVVCIEAKFGSKNPVAKEMDSHDGEKPKRVSALIDRYCSRNKIVDMNSILDLSKLPRLFYEQIFRNVVFAATMAKLEGTPEWHVINLRTQHVMNMKRGEPESMPIKRNIKSILRREHKRRFSHITWEDIYEISVKGDEELSNLAWYLKTKSLGCSRAFNIF